MSLDGGLDLLDPWRFTVLGYQAGFGRPLYLLLSLLAIGSGVVGIILAFRRLERVRWLVSARLAPSLAPGVSEHRPALKSAFVSAGLLLFAIALGQPQCGSRTELVKKRGIDVVVALDASKSMLARDVQPSRLERAKLELITLLDELKGDRVGLVIFAGDAFIQCPLTSDYSAAKIFLRAVDPEQMPQGGTDIGGALELARRVLDSADRGAKDRVVVLLSDGEDLAGGIDEQVKALADAQIKVFAVGIGSESGEPIPVYNRRGEMVGYQKDGAGQTVLSRLDRASLATLAERTGGGLFHQPNAVAMAAVVEEIDKLQKSELESRLTIRYAEQYQSFALPGLLLLVIGMMIRPSTRERATVLTVRPGGPGT